MDWLKLKESGESIFIHGDCMDYLPTMPEKFAPVLVGTTKEILQDSVLDRIAQLYFTAFSKDFLCFPYFSSLLHGE